MTRTTPATTPPKTGTGVVLGEQLAVFVDAVARATPPTDAARLAGYADPETTALDLLRLPEVRKALSDTVEGRLLSEAAPLALRTTLDILNDKSAPASIRGKMAIAVLDRVKSRDSGQDDGGKGLSGLSQGDLEGLVAQLERSGAVVVPRNVTPDPRPS